MAKFYGIVGFVSENVEVRPGVWDDVIVRKSYYGDVIRNTRKLDDGTTVNADISVGNSISILADAYANNHFFAMRFIEWAGTLWTVSDVEVQRPRLILRLGGVYNGPNGQETPPA